MFDLLHIPLFYDENFQNRKRICFDQELTYRIKDYKQNYETSSDKVLKLLNTHFCGNFNHYFLRTYISEKSYNLRKLPRFISKLRLQIKSISWKKNDENCVLEIQTKSKRYSSHLAKKIIKFPIGNELGYANKYLEVFVISDKHILNPYDDRGLDIVENNLC